jgi:hypothetical protein
MAFNLMDVKGNYKSVADTGMIDPAGLFNQPKDQWLGGSRGALDDLRRRYQGGQVSGQGQIDAGMGGVDAGLATLTGAGAGAQQNAAAAGAYGAQGQGIGLAALGVQDAAIANQNRYGRDMLATAQQQGPSAAEAQMQMGLDRTQRGMMAQASEARGGNQAAAMSGAQATGAQMALDVNQQASVLRAQEEDRRRQAIMGAQGNLASIAGQQQQVLGQRAGMGFGMQGQGLGLAQGSNAQLMDVGSAQGQLGLGRANVGLGQQGNYLSAEAQANAAQLGASQATEEAKAKYKGGVLSGFSSGLGSMFGG